MRALQEMLSLDLPIAEWAKEEGIGEEEIAERVHKAADEGYAARVEKNTPDVMRMVEKQIVLQVLDHFWREHLVQLEHLRQVIGWRGYAQRDPLNEYKSEAFDLFNNLIGRWHEVTTQQLMRVEISFDAPAGSGGGFEDQAAPADAMSDLNEINARIAAGEFAPTSLLFGGVGVSAADDGVPEPVRDPSDPVDLGQGRAQRAVSLRLRQEVQALPRRAGLIVRRAPRSPSTEATAPSRR